MKWYKTITAIVLAATIMGSEVRQSMATTNLIVNDLTLNVAAGSQSVAVGDTVTVTLDVANLSAPINGVQAFMHFDTTILQLNSIIPNSTIGGIGWTEAVDVDVAGDIDYVVVMNSAGAATQADHAVATLTFTALAAGTTAISFRADAAPVLTKLTVAADNTTLLPTKADSGAITVGTLAGPHVTGLELFYAGSAFGTCSGGANDGLLCSFATQCPGGTCFQTPEFQQIDPSKTCLATGAPLLCTGGGNDGLPCSTDADCPGFGTCASALSSNITNYMRGITGVRITFDSIVTFATTPEAAFSFEWTTGSLGTTFTPVDAAVVAGASATVSTASGVTVVNLVLADDSVVRRWLKITLDATQISAGGVALDGEVTGNPVALPSGNAIPGGNCIFYVASMPADTDDNRLTTTDDAIAVRLAVSTSQFVGIDSPFDVNKTRLVTTDDFIEARFSVSTSFKLGLITP
ncbi:MAG: cohesin domain-containing protein [Phycisphaerae bacterium]